ncbi:MAG: relaxase/mobilization nuclease domain-containing protein [Blautia faecis]
MPPTRTKTEEAVFRHRVNCDTATARDEMMIAKAEWHDESEIVCYHGFQSFKHGEVTPEVAHEVGVKLAEKDVGRQVSGHRCHPLKYRVPA